MLKSPVHLHSLPTLFATYPDARVAVTHRDPITLLASLTSLIANLRWAHSDTVDPKAIARAHVARYRASFERLVDWTQTGAVPAERLHHSRLADFQEDALAVVADLYRHFDIPWSDALAEAMGRTLSESPADRHAYTRDPLGADQDELRSAFARYQGHFGVPSDA